MRELKPKSLVGRVNLFDSYGEFVHAAMGPSEMADDQRSSRRESDSWAGGTWGESEKLAPVGDVQGAGKLRGAIIRQANKIKGQLNRYDPVYREDGGVWIDVSRYLSGEPECWGDMLPLGETRVARQVSIVFNACANCNIKAKDFERVSVAIGGAILGLKSTGISVSLFACYANMGGGRDLDITAVNMVSGEGSFDVARLAAVCKTWFFRRIVFAYWETRSKTFRENHGIFMYGGYGHTQSMSREMGEYVTGRKNTLVLNLERMTGQDDETIKNEILATVKVGGVLA